MNFCMWDLVPAIALVFVIVINAVILSGQKQERSELELRVSARNAAEIEISDSKEEAQE